MAAVLLVFVGASLAVVGVALLSPPAALIVSGVALAAAGLFIDFDRRGGAADGSAD